MGVCVCMCTGVCMCMCAPTCKRGQGDKAGRGHTSERAMERCCWARGGAGRGWQEEDSWPPPRSQPGGSIQMPSSWQLCIEHFWAGGHPLAPDRQGSPGLRAEGKQPVLWLRRSNQYRVSRVAQREGAARRLFAKPLCTVQV